MRYPHDILRFGMLGNLLLVAQTPDPRVEALYNMGLDEFLQLKVQTPSKTGESLGSAPATTLVLTSEDLRLRGYVQLSEMLDDLPGMEVVRSYSDTFLKNYWRGYRNTVGDPFLVLIDGLVFNHLHGNTADIPLATVPISNIDRVEVVYGPTSSVYGANAFMGVINIITLKDKPESGGSQRVNVSAGSMGRRVLDANYFFKKGDFRFSTTVRWDNGFVDNQTSENYEFTKNRYYADRRIWGGFVDNPNLGGKFESGWRNRALDMRAYWRDTEVGAQYLLLDTGYGLVYPGDLAQNNAVWARPELSLHLRHTSRINDAITGTTLVRYRESGLRPDSYFLDGYDNGAPDGYVAAFSYWQNRNNSWSFFQDFDIRFSNSLNLTTGLKYERKDLQKAYDIQGEFLDPITGRPYVGPLGDPSILPAWAYGAYIPVRNFSTNLGLYPFPAPPNDSTIPNNRIRTKDAGLFAQARWSLEEQHQLNLGARVDHNSEFGSSTTFRGGYVGTFGPLGIKGLYGEAYQEPAPRVLYGGWSGSGSDPNLSPEKSRTFELNASFTAPRFSALMSLWRVKDSDTIITLKPGTDKGAGANNIGERNVTGVDLHGQWLLPSTTFKQFKVWAYYSHYFRTAEEKFQFNATTQQFVPLGAGEIGDLAKNKAWLGFTAVLNNRADLTLRARYVGERLAVDTNLRNDLPGSPVTVVPAFTTVDLSANLRWRRVGLSLRIDNLFDRQYFHPGLRDAAAGFVPGTFAPDGQTYSGGSRSNYYNALLPQPGRALLLTLKLDY